MKSPYENKKKALNEAMNYPKEHYEALLRKREYASAIGTTWNFHLLSLDIHNEVRTKSWYDSCVQLSSRILPHPYLHTP